MINEEQPVDAIRRMAPSDLGKAIELLPGVLCPRERRSLASLVAGIWSRRNINMAWKAVSRSNLSAADKRVMFNELWS
jgi:hypothetical protein